MERAKTKTATPASNGATEYRENPKTNEKIDAWIRANPDRFKFFNEMPHERAVRKLVLNEVEKYERVQKKHTYNLQKLEGDPEAKQAYETLLKRVPEADRERLSAGLASHVLRLVTPHKDAAKTQSQGAKMAA